VSILPALSKVLETHVKENLEDHLRKVNGLPGSQYGFCPKRSCISALAHAQASWLLGAAKGQVVGLMAFNLSAAFDTVAAKQLSPTLQALANHLPRGAYLRQLSYGLVMGKFAHTLGAVARPRLDHEDNASVIWSKIQVAFNDVARSITGARRRDHITIKYLLDLAGIESANRMMVKAIAAETWSCYHSDDGKDGARNHVWLILFTDNKTDTAKTTRSARTSQITVPLRGGDTFVTHADNVWNRSSKLRGAPTKVATKKAASDLAGLSPL
jgi:hypothetical protein